MRLCQPARRDRRLVVVGGLAAEGQTLILDVSHIERGYEDFESKMSNLGADITLVDAPVSGGPAGADAGTIAIMVGGPEKVYEELHAVFTSISPNVFHCGEQVGAGHTMKLVNNVIAAGVREVTFEAIAMGAKSGLSLAKMTEVLDKGSAHSFTTQRTLPRLVAGEGTETFALRLMHKDVRLATQRGIDSGAPMPLAGVVREFLQLSLNDDGEDKSVNWTLRMVERNAGIRIADVG